MFTVKELNVMRSALCRWAESQEGKKDLEVARKLIERFEALLYDRYHLERRIDAISSQDT